MIVNQVLLIKISEKLLQNVKSGISINNQINSIAKVTIKELGECLTSDDAKKVFWINIYNAFIQITGTELENSKNHYFKKKRIEFRDLKLSFDDIEHSILRKGKCKYSLGYFNNLFIKNQIKRLQVEQIDFRIHFALNCGAESCPPILFYSLNQIESQLEIATESFIEKSTTVEHQRKRLKVSRLFLFYLNDFGNKKGIRKLLKEKGLIDHTAFKIEFDKYDWTLELNNFVS